MTDLAAIAKVQDVKSAVLGDLAGGYLDAFDELDGESVAAVMGFVSSSLVHAGDQLGLGSLRRISVASDAHACVVVVQDELVITACVEPAKSLGAVEKALDIAVQGKV
jgi:predicted regulator of Ras-like GTPase activity (Roadblock/LC7/MglB family)